MSGKHLVNLSNTIVPRCCVDTHQSGAAKHPIPLRKMSLRTVVAKLSRYFILAGSGVVIMYAAGAIMASMSLLFSNRSNDIRYDRALDVEWIIEREAWRTTVFVSYCGCPEIESVNSLVSDADKIEAETLSHYKILQTLPTGMMCESVKTPSGAFFGDTIHVQVGWPARYLSFALVDPHDGGALQHRHAIAFSINSFEFVLPLRVYAVSFGLQSVCVAAMMNICICAPGLLRRHMRGRAGLCLACGYPKIGPLDRCPECGRSW